MTSSKQADKSKKASMETVKALAVAYGAGAIATKALGVVMHVKAVPVLMAATGKVVSGVGTIHAAGSLTAITQATACALMSTGGVLVGGVVGVGALGVYAVAKLFR